MKNRIIYEGFLLIADKDRLIDELSKTKDSTVKIIDTPMLKYQILYPITNPINVKEKLEDGWSIGDICMSIANNYHKIYQEENETTQIPAGHMIDVGLMNRNETNGKYGIWGHDIEDLCIEILEIANQTEEYTEIKLFIGS